VKNGKVLRCLKVGGFKVFRDLIYGLGGVIFPADYRYYRRQKMFDYPTKDVKARLVNGLARPIMGVRKVQVKVQAKMGEAMLAGPKKILTRLDPAKERQMLEH